MPILLVTPFLDPESVGEPRWCYDLARAICARTETVIVTQTTRHRSFTVADLFPGTKVIENEAGNFDFLPFRVRALMKPDYVRFYSSARKAIETQIDLGSIRCAHHFGPLALRYPTPLRKAGTPYVFGPLGGSLPTPPGFDGGNGSQPWYYRLRDFDRLRFRHDPWLRSSYENAACLVGVADYVRDVLAPLNLKAFATCPEIAAKPPVADIDAVLEQRQQREGPVRFLIVSRLFFSKGVQYALRAAAALDRNPAWQIDILGDGPMRGELEREAQSLGLADRVTFHGHVPRASVDDFYRAADIFLFPSIREPSGAVVFEAMSWGLPMVAADYGGPAAHVDPAFGIRATVTSETAFVDGIRDAMRQLLVSAEERRKMSEAALEAARTRHSIDAMADFYLELYARYGRK